MADTLQSRRETLGHFKMTRDKQADAVTAETGNELQHPLDAGSGLQLEFEREDDRAEVTGNEGPTQVFEKAQSATGTLTQSRARPHFINHMMLYTMGGTPTSTSTGTTSYRHDGAWVTGNEMPYFTFVQRLGDNAEFEQYVGCAVNTLTLSLSDKWVSAEANIIATGLRNTQNQRITIDALDNATSFTLTDQDSNDWGVAGTTSERVTNLYRIAQRVSGSNDWTALTPTVVSAADPAVVTVSASAGGAGATVDTHVYFKTDSSVAWAATASGVSAAPLRLVDAQVSTLGAWNGTSWSGSVLNLNASTGDTVEFNLENNLVARQIPDATGNKYASEIRRGADGRRVTMSVSRRFADPILKLLADENTTDFSLRFLVQGAVIDTGDTERYGFEIVIPAARFTAAATRTIEEGEESHTLEIEAMVDATYNLFDYNGWDTVASYLG